MGRITHFEIHADDPERAARFYTDVFGWQIKKWGGPVDYWLVTTGPDGEPGINGAIMRRASPVDGEAVIAYVCTASVDDIDATIARIEKHGVPNALPKGPIPGVGWQAYYKDTEGNVFGIHQSDPKAA
jgi:predicted enzyme related to lactoylglutathione lyase